MILPSAPSDVTHAEDDPIGHPQSSVRQYNCASGQLSRDDRRACIAAIFNEVKYFLA
jgi:hypothetical protein